MKLLNWQRVALRTICSILVLLQLATPVVASAATTGCSSSDPSTGGGLSCAQKQVFESGINYFDVTSCGASSTTSASGAAADAALVGSDSAEKAFNFFRSEGLTAAQSAGIVGNMILESSLDPTATNPNSGTHGIVQWLGGRLAAERAWTTANHLDPDSLSGQLAYVWQELQTSEANSLAQLKTTNTPDAAALNWSENYEVGGHSEDAKRVADAEAVYNKYKDTPAPPLLTNATTATSASDVSATSFSADCGSTASSANFNGYFQTDPQWANIPYPDGGGMSTIGISGCGITSLATVISTLTGDHTITPASLAQELISKGIPSTTSSLTAFTTFAGEHGLAAKYYSGMDQFNAAFAQVTSSGGNALMIVNADPGYWTTVGHYFVVRGLAPDGNVQVWDVGESTKSHPKTDKTYTPDFMSSKQTNASGYFVISKANA